MYDEFSTEYDKMVDWPGRLALEIPFLASRLRESGASRILDAGCGTGRHALALAAEGFRVSGADYSPAMVDRAMRLAAESGARVDFRTAAFGGLTAAFFGEEPFDAILVLGNSLPHLLDAESLAAALTDFSRLLKPAGLLLLQNRNFDAVLARRVRWMEPQHHSGGGSETLFVRFYDFEPDGHILFHILTIRRAPDGSWRQHESSIRLWPQQRAELEAALAHTGFARTAAYGFVDGSPFDESSSPNLILLARRNPPAAHS